MEATVRLEHDLLALDGEHDVHVMLELAVPAAAHDAAREPLQLAVVLDRSGSMSGGPLRTVAQAAAYLVDRLQADDGVALVTYDDEAELIAPLGADRATALAALRAVTSGGMTNLSGGWLLGREQLATVTGARRILLLTDGQANRGITDDATLAALVGAAAGEGIGTTCIGVGEHFNEDLLGHLADAAGGNYRFLERADDAPQAFAEEFTDLVALVAQNVSVEVRPHPAVEVLGVLNDLPSTPVDGGVRIQIGDAYAGQRRRVVLRLHVPSLAAVGPVTIAELVLRHVSVGAQIEQRSVTLPVLVNLVSADEAAAAAADAEVVEEVHVLTAAQIAEDAKRRADAGDHDGAARLLREASEMIGQNGDDAEHQALSASWALMSQDIAADGMTGLNRKQLHQQVNQTRTRKSPRRGDSQQPPDSPSSS